MKFIGLLGASALGQGTFVEDLIHAFRFDGWSVSTIKRAPDGFDLDQPGKGSWARLYTECCTHNRAIKPQMIVADRRRKDLSMSAPNDVKEVVREKYSQAALRVTAGQIGCCAGAPRATDCCDPITSNLYDAGQAGEVPDAALKASLGCGNPTALAELKPGETVLDLGSGGGIDVLLSAKRVGSTGKAYGLDMTDEMLALAEENRRKSGLTNVEFLKGEIEHIPLPDNTVDVIISNCVINLSGDKDQVLKEAFRVLKPGGRFAVSDVVVRGEVPSAIRKSMELWVGCVAGALSETDYKSKLATAGFANIDVEVTRVYGTEDAREFLSAEGLDADAIAENVDGKFVSAFIRAAKPQGCCAPGCCSR
jgi:arsenite methyltransferase